MEVRFTDYLNQLYHISAMDYMYVATGSKGKRKLEDIEQENGKHQVCSDATTTASSSGMFQV